MHDERVRGIQREWILPVADWFFVMTHPYPVRDGLMTSMLDMHTPSRSWRAGVLG